MQKSVSFPVLRALGPTPPPSKCSKMSMFQKKIHFAFLVRIESFLYEMDLTLGPNNTLYYIFFKIAMCMTRHGICQMFYTSEIPEIFNFTRNNTCIATFFLAKKMEYWMFFASILIKLSVFLQISSHIQSYFSYIVKISA